MAKFDKKAQVYRLRKQGESIGDIAKDVGVSKSTVSLWCRNIKLTRKQEERLKQKVITAGHKGRLLGAQVNKQKRLDAIDTCKKTAKKEIRTLSQRDLTILAAALFWAEGAKTGSRFIFINSDPNMMLCMLRYLVEVEKVDQSRLSVTVQINKVHKARIQKVLQFWSSFLKVPIAQFGTPYYIKVAPKKVYDNYNTYYGIARLAVREGSSLQYKMLGYINALTEDSKKPG